MSEFQCLQRQGWEHRAQCCHLQGLQGHFLPWRKVPAGSHPLSPGPSLLGPLTTVGRLALGRQEITSVLGPSPFRSCQDSLVPQGFLHPGKFCELLENHDFFFFFNFTILYRFCHTSTWVHHECTRVPNPEPPPTSLPIPSLWVISDFSGLNFLRWNARRSNQSILKEISPEYSLERLMLKLKLQYFGHLIWTDYSLEKSLVLGKIEGRRRRGQQRMRRWMASPTNKFNYQEYLGEIFLTVRYPIIISICI